MASETSPAEQHLAEDLAAGRIPAAQDCELCHGTGVMAWMQPCPDGVMREIAHPCPRHGDLVQQPATQLAPGGQQQLGP